MKVIIFEGIATSGKTTITRLLAEKYRALGKSVLVIDENQTLMPIIENWSVDANVSRCLDVVDRAVTENPDVVLFDRLYFSHIFRTECEEKEFDMVREALSALNPTFVMLEVQTERIEARIFESLKHRDASWAEFVWKKGTNRDEIIKYYVDQQQWFQDFFHKTSFNKVIIDTTDMDFSAAAEQVFISTS